jgi:hypothetical protein
MNPSLKELQTRRGKLQAERDRLAHEAKDAQRAVAECEKRLRAVEQELQAVQRQDVQVSEHAILRYIERGMPARVSITEIRDLIRDAVSPYVDQLGNGKYPLSAPQLGPIGINGLRAVVRDRVVVTVE